MDFIIDTEWVATLELGEKYISFWELVEFHTGNMTSIHGSEPQDPLRLVALETFQIPVRLVWDANSERVNLNTIKV